ncbi:hypothetical protein HG536_0E02320 [Torulaspora globosa]|uniref:GTP-binding protein YPT11 n=1 Tax=Torulaspora globosa TaxID=48254 RepID=A0A7G3ZII5_9SACH|nr:uncharacterized protein HG536_0E02320 [Torulaspora globosa]QLL33321.1 hypothetical protein HG536_0E02320 [Torulaspora globosa]
MTQLYTKLPRIGENLTTAVSSMSGRKRYSVHVPVSPLSPVLPIHASAVDGSQAFGSASSNASTPRAVYHESSSFYRIPSKYDQISMDSMSHKASNLKLLLIGDAGVGKTAMILGYCNELPTKSQLKIMSAASTPVKNKPEQDKGGPRNQKKIDMRKRYSLNDYEELFHKRQKFGGLMIGTNQSSDEFIPEVQTDDDSDEFVLDTRSTIGVDIKTSIINIDNRFFKCILWDTAGQERYRNAMIPLLYKGANGIILAYDICNLKTFQSCCDHWLREALDNFDTRDLAKVRFYLIGSKIDLYKDRQVTHEQVLRAIETIKSRFNVSISGNFEITCKWPHVVERTINLIIKDLVENGCYENVDSLQERTPSLDTSPTSSELASECEDGENRLHCRNKGSRSQPSRKDSSIDLSKPLNDIKASSCCV